MGSPEMPEKLNEEKHASSLLEQRANKPLQPGSSVKVSQQMQGGQHKGKES